MNAELKDIVRGCSIASDEGRVRFGEVVATLSAAGVERYHADLVRAEKTYYLPDGTSELVPNAEIAVAPAQQFSASAVAQTIKAIQAGTIDYRTFCERVVSAGCVAYMVSIVGRRAVYYGRTGDSHVEWFPGAT